MPFTRYQEYVCEQQFGSRGCSLMGLPGWTNLGASKELALYVENHVSVSSKNGGFVAIVGIRSEHRQLNRGEEEGWWIHVLAQVV